MRSLPTVWRSTSRKGSGPAALHTLSFPNAPPSLWLAWYICRRLRVSDGSGEFSVLLNQCLSIPWTVIHGPQAFRCKTVQFFGRTYLSTRLSQHLLDTFLCCNFTTSDPTACSISIPREETGLKACAYPGWALFRSCFSIIQPPATQNMAYRSLYRSWVCSGKVSRIAT